MTDIKPVYIKWKDHCSFDSQHWRDYETTDYLVELVVASTMGWVLKETDDVVVVAQTIDPKNEKFSGVMAILKSCIIERRELST